MNDLYCHGRIDKIGLLIVLIHIAETIYNTHTQQSKAQYSSQAGDQCDHSRVTHKLFIKF